MMPLSSESKKSVSLPTLAIIGGTGKEGTGLALRWAAAGYKIVIGSREAEKAKIAASQINERLDIRSVSGDLNADAVLAADICFLTVIHAAHDPVLHDLKAVLYNKILIDTTSRVDFRNPIPPEPPSAAERARKILDQSMQIVAAFQIIPAKLLSSGIGEPLDADVLICSDDFQAAEQVIKLAQAAGMRGLYAGGLVNSNIVEGITSILISLNKHYGIKDASIKVEGIPG